MAVQSPVYFVQVPDWRLRICLCRAFSNKDPTEEFRIDAAKAFKDLLARFRTGDYAHNGRPRTVACIAVSISCLISVLTRKTLLVAVQRRWPSCCAALEWSPS